MQKITWKNLIVILTALVVFGVLALTFKSDSPLIQANSVQASSHNQCANIVLPSNCIVPWLEYSLKCVNLPQNPAWIRTCYKPVNQ